MTLTPKAAKEAVEVGDDKHGRGKQYDKSPVLGRDGLNVKERACERHDNDLSNDDNHGDKQEVLIIRRLDPLVVAEELYNVAYEAVLRTEVLNIK